MNSKKILKKHNIFAFIASVLIFLLIGYGVFLNIKQQRSIDRTKLPQKVEFSKGFQKWLTNLKNKKFNIEGDEFRLVEENEIYNTKWMKVYSLDETGVQKAYEENLALHENLKKIVYSPSKKQYIDFRDEVREGYMPNQIHYYGVREDKLLDARILDCATNLNCYFDRAYFLDNDSFVISEFSRVGNKRDPNLPVCTTTDMCAYSFKVHVIDLNKNSRLVYESKPFNAIFENVKPEL